MSNGNSKQAPKSRQPSPAQVAPAALPSTAPHPPSDLTPSPRRSFKDWLTNLASVFVLLTPIVYFNGRGYHEGWCRAFNLDSDMFPLSTQDMLTQGGEAWLTGLAYMGATIGTHFEEHFDEIKHIFWFASALAIIYKVLIEFRDPLAKWVADQADKTKKGRLWKWFRLLIVPVLQVAFAFPFLYALFLTVILALAALIDPFATIGRHVAQDTINHHFSDRPWLALKRADGTFVDLPEVASGPQFVALWNNGQTIVVPNSAITWDPSFDSSNRRLQPSRPPEQQATAKDTKDVTH